MNGEHACGSAAVLERDLKQGLGFDGWVMSDWMATHALSILDGLDQQMPGSLFFGRSLARKAAAEARYEAALNTSAHRLLTTLVRVGVMDGKAGPGSVDANVTCESHRRVARDVAAAGVVLLKNDADTLPLPSAGALRVRDG